MIIDRRGFLGTLFASVAASTIPADAFLGRPAAPRDYHPSADPQALRDMTKEVAKLLGQYWHPHVLTPAGQIGEDGLLHQFHVTLTGLPLEVHRRELHERYIMPIAVNLAYRLNGNELLGERASPHALCTRCGTLPHDLRGVMTAVVTQRSRHLSVRGAIQYNIQTDTYPVRFDVLAG